MRWLDGITDSVEEFEQTPGDSEGQGSLACCSPWGRKELNTTEQPNWFSTLNRVYGPVFEDIMSQSSGLG